MSERFRFSPGEGERCVERARNSGIFVQHALVGGADQDTKDSEPESLAEQASPGAEQAEVAAGKRDVGAGKATVCGRKRDTAGCQPESVGPQPSPGEVKLEVDEVQRAAGEC